MDEGESLLKDMLTCGVLPDVDTEETCGHPLSVLKYSRLKNMGSVLVQEKDFNGALSCFIQASKLNYSDVMLWYDIGSVASELQLYELSRDAFLEALNICPKNWECLNRLIMILYVLRDYILCLVFISRAFELDPTFIKGHIIKDAILEEDPNILSTTYLDGIYLGPKHVEYEKELAEEILNEAKKLRAAKVKKKEEAILKPIPLEEPLITKTWVSLGKSLIAQHKRQQESLVTRLDLLHDPEKRNGTIEKLNMKFHEHPYFENVLHSENMPCSGNDNENPNQEDVVCALDNDYCKGRKKRRKTWSSIPELASSGKHRKTSVLSTVQGEAEEEEEYHLEEGKEKNSEEKEWNLEETLLIMFPYSPSPSTEKIKDMDNMKSNDDSMDTMDLYILFENLESVEGRVGKNSDQRMKGKVVTLQSEEYFGSETEQLDVVQFLNVYNYHDLIDLLDFYLRELNNRWQLTWPKELTYVFIEAYQLRRIHVPYPDILCPVETLEWIFKEGCLTLLFEELSLDYWLTEKINDQKNDRTTEKRPVPYESIGYLELMLSRFPKEHVMRSRTYWVKAHAHLSNGDVAMATTCLDLLIQHIESGKGDEKIVTLKNCIHNRIISRETAEYLLTALFRYCETLKNSKGNSEPE